MGVFKYKWFATGDIGASATIIFDNLTVLAFMSLILTLGYHFPVEIIKNHIIPGSVMGIIAGNLLCFYLSFKLAKKLNKHVTAVPFGLDAPSAIGISICIVGPAFTMFQQSGMDINQAGIMSWHIGIGGLFIIAFIKLFFSLFAEKVKSAIPQAALLGAIAGVAIALIGFTSLESIFKTPIVGLTVLAIVFLTIFAKVKLPFNLSSIPVAIIVGTVLYYILIPFKLSGSMPNLSGSFNFIFPIPSLAFINDFNYIEAYIPLVIPFALLVIFGSMAVAESSASMNENYKIRDLIIIDSISTFIIALCGGISQTTPYAGFPAYKKLDARAGYLLINVIVVGIGGLCGLVAFLVNIIPEAALGPVLLFVAFEIASQGFIQCDKKYTVAILFAVFPSLARLLAIKFTNGSLIEVSKLQSLCFLNCTSGISDTLAIIMLGNGFIITGTLWGALLCFAISKRWNESVSCALLLSLFSYFGVIHSIYITGKMYIPYNLPEDIKHIPLEVSLGYIAVAIIIFILSKFRNQINLD